MERGANVAKVSALAYAFSGLGPSGFSRIARLVLDFRKPSCTS